MRLILTLTALLTATSLSACSSQQFYGAGQAWQHNTCNRISDMQERNRCMASANRSHDDYQRESEAVKGSPK